MSSASFYVYIINKLYNFLLFYIILPIIKNLIQLSVKFANMRIYSYFYLTKQFFGFFIAINITNFYICILFVYYFFIILYVVLFLNRNYKYNENKKNVI